MSEQAAAQATETPAAAVPTDAAPPQVAPSTPFSQIAKKEAELVRKREAFKKEQEAFSTERQKAEHIQKQVALFEETRKKDPVAALKMIGFSETDIFNYMAANQQKELSPEEKAAKIASETVEARLKAFEEAQNTKVLTEQTERDKSLLNEYKSGLSKFVTSNKEDLKYCAYWGSEAVDLAYQIALENAKVTGGEEALSVQDALKLAEEYYRERDQDMEKIRNRPAAAPPSKGPERTRTVNAPDDPSYQPKPTITRQRTLTNAATPVGTKPRGAETPAQTKQRIIDMVRAGKL